MGIPRRGGYSALRRVTRARSESYDVERPSTTRSRFGDEQTTTVTISNVRLWIQPPTNIVSNTEFGDREEADAVAIALDGADVQQNDRVVDGGTEYEVHGIDYVPNERNAKLLRVNLMERVND